MTQSYKKFYDVRRFCQAVFQAHQEGNPMNPAGCKGNPRLMTYQETDEKYTGKTAIFGTHIQAFNIPELCASINQLLDDGAEVLINRAYSIRGVIRVPINQGAANVSETEEDKNENTGSDTSGEAGAAQDDSASTGSGDASQEPAQEEVNANEQGADSEAGEEGEDVQAGDEAESSSETSEDESDESGASDVSEADSDNEKPAVDWAHAEALETKKELDEYAESLGIKLDRRKSRADMMESFREQAGE